MRLDPDASCVVMAHPDDEVLWASSIVSNVRRVVLCYGDVPGNAALSAGRRRAVAALELPGLVSLDIPVTGAYGRADWPGPAPSRAGLALRDDLLGAAAAEARYAATYDRLVAALDPHLSDVASVVTHNPWGEYGHEEHVQVFRAVVELSRRHGFAVWVTGYVGDRSGALMRRHLADLAEETPPLPTDPALGDRLRRIYAEAGCWTWFDDYAWPPTESFHRFVPGGCDRPGRVRQLNAIWLDWTPPPRKSALRRWLGRLRRRVTPAPPDR